MPWRGHSAVVEGQRSSF